MLDAPKFFVPGASSDDQEQVYVELARWCRGIVPPLGNRVYSITYVHDGEEWTATVGQALRGVRRKTCRSRGVRSDQTIHLNDPATVLAIFPGTPYMVVTNHRIAGGVVSAWENPFMAGEPRSITYFSPSHNGEA